jgi:von Willebrand factor type A domain
MSLSSRFRRDRRWGLLAALILAACALHWRGAAGAAAQLDIVRVDAAGADRQVTVIADVRPSNRTPIPARSFSVTAGEERLPTRVVPVMSDQLAMSLVVDASGKAAETLQAGLSGATNLLLQLPTAARVAAVADTGPPTVIAPLRAGAKDVLSALDSVRPRGSLATSEALTVALDQLPVTAGEPRVVLLFTGAGDAGGETAAALVERLRNARAQLAVVATAADKTYWSRVTSETGGVLVSARPADLLTAFQTVADTLSARYLLTFPRPQQLPASVSVRVDTADGTLTADAFIPGGPSQAGSNRGGSIVFPLLAIGVGVCLILMAAATLLLRTRTRARATPTTAAVQNSTAVPNSTAVLNSTATATAGPGTVTPTTAVPAPSTRPRVEPLLARRTPAARPAADEAAEVTSHPVTAPDDYLAADDEGAYDELDAHVADAAVAVETGELDRRRAIASIALAAPGRADLLDRLTEAQRRLAGSPLADRPPTGTVLDLLASARRVVLGQLTLAGPDGVRVEQTAPSGADPLTRTVLRLTRNGRWECDCRTLDELAQHVDISTLVAS